MEADLIVEVEDIPAPDVEELLAPFAVLEDENATVVVSDDNTFVAEVV